MSLLAESRILPAGENSALQQDFNRNASYSQLAQDPFFAHNNQIDP